MRRLALDERTALVEATKNEADTALAAARAQLERDVADARTRLGRDAEALGAEAATRILGRQVS
jgi:hypothetical protein